MVKAIIFGFLLLLAFGWYYFSRNHTPSNKMDPQTAKQKIEQDSGIVIDVRSRGEYAGGHLKKAKYNWDIMSGEFQDNLQQLDKEQTYYLYCRSGNRSEKAAGTMRQQGFENVFNIGGYQSLVNAGLESVRGMPEHDASDS
jgi:phage shock protein E